MKNRMGSPTAAELFGFDKLPGEESNTLQDSKFPWAIAIAFGLVILAGTAIIYHQHKNYKNLRSEMSETKNRFSQDKESL